MVAAFQQQNAAGIYVRLGNTVESVYRAVGGNAPTGDKLGESDVAQAAEFKTTLRRLTSDEFELLMRHGFEVTNATLATRQEALFSYVAQSS